jgi:autotransporter-associated beta strand protein
MQSLARNLSVLTFLCAAVHSSADVIYSNLQDTPIALDYAGTLIDVDSNGSWDLNPYLGGVYLANNTLFQPVRDGTNGMDTVQKYASNTTIHGGLLYATGMGGSIDHLGTTFTAGQEGYLGFKLGSYFGWMRVVFTNNTAGAVIKDWAYETSGAAIVTGNVLQSTAAGNAQTVTLTATSGSITLGSAITDTGDNTNSVVKTGAGTTALTGVNSYRGPTTITQGVLALSGSGSIANTSRIDVSTSGAIFSVTGLTGNFTLGSSQTLGGNGMVLATNKIVTAYGTISPGNSPGTLTQDGGTLQLGANANLNWQVYAATAAAGTGYDTVSLTNGATLDLSLLDSSNPYNINLWSLSSISPVDVNGDAIGFNNTQNYTWTIFSTDATISGFNPNLFNIMTAANNGTSGFSNDLGGGSFAIGLADGNTDLVMSFTTIIPEPRAALLGSLGLLFALLRRRRPDAFLRTRRHH